MKLLFAGDFCPFDGGFPSFSERLRRQFQSADCSFVNLECPLTNSSAKIVKCGPNIKAHPKQVQCLLDLGATGVTLANNHVLDYGAEGVADTLQTCRGSHLLTVGAGEDIRSAANPLLLTKCGERIAVLNYAEREFCAASMRSAGANSYDLIHVLQDIDSLKGRADGFLIVIHGGQEHIGYPSPDTVRTFRFLAEQVGVLAIVRHHPHIIQAAEMWKSVPIFYSLGNFYFPMKQNHGEHWNHGLLAEITIEGARTVDARSMKVSVSSCSNGCYVVDVEGDCRIDDARLDVNANARNWRMLVEQRRDCYRASLVVPSGLIGRALRKLKVHRLYDRDAFRNRLISNLLRCDAHLEVLRNAFNVTNIAEEL